MERITKKMERRKPEYLSPTSIKKFDENIDEWYISYISPYRPPKIPQTQPMSIGSAFDAYVKSDLHRRLIGKVEPKFEFDTLFEAQVEPHNRDWAKFSGLHVFTKYKEYGAYSDLLIELEHAVTEPSFEIEVKGIVDGKREGLKTPVGGVMLLGKPDLYFINSSGRCVLYDWKVNGYCGNSKKSPEKGYIYDLPNRKPHKDAILGKHQGLTINSAHNLNDVNTDWATQLATYGWLCGETIGSDFIVGIDQVCGNRFDLRFAKHRCLISNSYQWLVFTRYCKVQNAIDSEHYFPDLSKSDSDKKAKELDLHAKSLYDLSSDGSYESQMMLHFVRGTAVPTQGTSDD